MLHWFLGPQEMKLPEEWAWYPDQDGDKQRGLSLSAHDNHGSCLLSRALALSYFLPAL